MHCVSLYRIALLAGALTPAGVLGFIIPDPKTAYQLVLDGSNDRTAKGSSKNVLDTAYDDALGNVAVEKDVEKSLLNKWEYFPASQWASNILNGGDKDSDDDEDDYGRHGRYKKHGGYHGRDRLDIEDDYDDYRTSSPWHKQDDDFWRHHGFRSHPDRDRHTQPHSDHGPDGLSSHRTWDEIPRPHRDGHYHNEETIWDIVSNSKHTTMFKELAERDEMFKNTLSDPKQNITLFVPTDHAFRKLFPEGKLPKDLPEDVVDRILVYHTAEGTHISEDLRAHNTLLSRLQENKLGEGMHQRIRLGLDMVQGPSINFRSRILLTDVLCKNGVIHGINSVLLPPPCIADILNLLPSEFSTTLTALYKTGLIEEIGEPGGHKEHDKRRRMGRKHGEDDDDHHEHAPGLTVFAPSNRDWEKLGVHTTAWLFSEHGDRYLKALMKYHIVPGVSLYSDALEKPESHHTRRFRSKKEDKAHIKQGYEHMDLKTMLHDQDLHVDVTRFERFLSFRVNGYNKIIISDGIANDGVVHVPSHVMFPSTKWEEGKDDIGLRQVDGEGVTVEQLKMALGPYVQAERYEDEL